MKIHNIKNGLKKASAVALATLSVCPSMNAAGHREHEEESSSVVSNMASAIVGGCIVGGAWVLTHFFGGKKTGEVAETGSDMLGNLVSKAYEIYSDKTQNEDEKALIKAIYAYWMYSMSHAFDELELVGNNEEKLKASKEYELFNNLKILTDEEKKVIAEHIKTKGCPDCGGAGNSSYKKFQLSYAIDFLYSTLISSFVDTSHELRNSEALKFLETLCDKKNTDTENFRNDPFSRLSEFGKRLREVKKG